MSEQKQNPTAPIFPEKNSDREGVRIRESNGRNREKGITPSDAKDVGGWEAYRRWLTRVQAPTQGRAPLDPGLYTWKGYRNWSDKVRRDWSPDDQ